MQRHLLCNKGHYPNGDIAEISSCNKAHHDPTSPTTYKSNEPVESEGRSGVVSAVVEGRNLVVLPGVVALLEEGPAGGVQGADGLEGGGRKMNWCINNGS